MSYRDDLGAALARVEQLGRELATAAQAAGERDHALAEAARLRGELDAFGAENRALRRTQYALPRAYELRLVAGLAVAWFATIHVLASWFVNGGAPPLLGVEAAPMAAIGALVGAIIMGLGGPHRLAALAVLGGTGLLLAAKPYVKPVTYSFGEFTKGTFGITSETHLYFLIPGLAALALTAILATIRRKPPAPPRPSKAP